MKILVDTNVLLDVLCKRPAFYEDSAKIFKLCEAGEVSGIISALSVPNIVYIMRKELDTEKIKHTLENLSLIFSIMDLTGEDLHKAANMDFKDYEDAIQSACAVRAKANFLITRNISGFGKSQIPALLPSELLTKFTCSI